MPADGWVARVECNREAAVAFGRDFRRFPGKTSVISDILI